MNLRKAQASVAKCTRTKAAIEAERAAAEGIGKSKKHSIASIKSTATMSINSHARTHRVDTHTRRIIINKLPTAQRYSKYDKIEQWKLHFFSFFPICHYAVCSRTHSPHRKRLSARKMRVVSYGWAEIHKSAVCLFCYSFNDKSK